MAAANKVNKVNFGNYTNPLQKRKRSLPNEPDLLLAITNNQPIQALLDNKTDVNALCPNGSTVLQLALDYMYEKNVAINILPLLEAKVDTNICNKQSVAPVLFTAMKLTIDNTTTLTKECPERNRIVQQLLDAGADPNASVKLNTVHTALIRATFVEDAYSLFHLLIQAKANVNAKPYNQTTVLHHAAIRLHSECLQLLLDNGAYPSLTVRDNNGYTPLDLARMRTYNLHNDLGRPCIALLKETLAACGMDTDAPCGDETEEAEEEETGVEEVLYRIMWYSKSGVE
jgi:hypothetical protein